MKPLNFYICILLLLALAACKTNKQPSNKNGEKASRKELKNLSSTLNLELSQNDNINLYTFVAEWLGVPHKDGGCEKSGTDCSCFVRMAYDYTYHKNIPRNSAEMYKQSKRIDTAELHEGDLVFFKIKSTKISHVGIYLKDNWFAHVSSSKGVMINNLNEKYYRGNFAGAGRVQ